MNYEPLISRNGRYRNFFPFSLKIVLSAAVILFALYFFAPQALSSFFTMIARPFWTIGKSDEQNKPIFYAGVVALQKENEELKELLGRTEKSDKILAVILKKPPVSAYDVFILDIGDDKGLKKGDRVYARGDILIGEIAEVNGRTSKAKLYSSPGEKFGVLIGDKNIQATATGKGGGTFEIVLPHDTKIAVGDSVAVPDLTDSFFGNVEDVISEPTNPFSTVLFRQPINIYELKWLMVEKKI